MDNGRAGKVSGREIAKVRFGAGGERFGCGVVTHEEHILGRGAVSHGIERWRWTSGKNSLWDRRLCRG